MNSPDPKLQQWIGRKQAERDTPTGLRVTQLAATLDDGREYPAGADLPPGWHWILFQTTAATASLSEDGHAPRGGFLPPVTLPRRMWAGGRLKFHQPLRVDEPVERKSEIASVTEKSGRNGQLVFVTVKHALHGSRGLAIEEEQDIVYREATAGASAPQPAPHQDPVWKKQIRTNVPMLFRYSALIFVGHRIHYDREYATKVEGYGGLVVHGPLIATCLLNLSIEKSKARLVSFSYRGVSPLFDTAPFHVCGQPAADGRSAEVWAETPQGALAMTAKAEFA
jgi:3-methylfumaryl-CoA hydratase